MIAQILPDHALSLIETPSGGRTIDIVDARIGRECRKAGRGQHRRKRNRSNHGMTHVNLSKSTRKFQSTRALNQRVL